MIYLLYDTLWSLVSIFFFPVFISYTLFTGKKRKGLFNLFGFFFDLHEKDNYSQKRIWIHALSVGEVKAATPVVKELKKQLPDSCVILSVTTEAGYATAKTIIPIIDYVTYAPFDFFLCIQAAFKKIKPDCVILTETGLWPNLLRYSKKYNIPSIFIHGKISDRSFKKYKSFKSVISPIFDSFSSICVQHKHTIQQFIELGIKKEKIIFIGNIKFDNLEPVKNEIISNYKKKFGITESIYVFIAGSTHKGEEEAVINLFLSLKKQFNLLLIIAPRRLERIEEIETLLNKKSILYDKATSLGVKQRSADIVILDTMGELSKVYAIGQIIFLGNSLFSPGGGHNLLEPLASGKIVMHGTHMGTDKSFSKQLDDKGITIEIKNTEDMTKKTKLFFMDEKARHSIIEKTQLFIKENQGVAKRQADIILKLLSS